MKRELRPHQSQAIEMLRQSLGSGKRRPVLQAPTGFGKTRLAAAVVEGALAKKKRVIFGGPKGRRNGNYKRGLYTAEAIATRKWLRQQIRQVRALTKRLRQP